jgi:hypothetical protein
MGLFWLEGLGGEARFVVVLVVVLVLEFGHAEYWSDGVLEYWSIGVLEYWSIGVLEYWSIGVLERWSDGVMECCELRWISFAIFAPFCGYFRFCFYARLSASRCWNRSWS